MARKYNRKMKMAQLVEQDFHLLALTARFGFDRSFGEKTVETFCGEYRVDPDTFLLLCEVYSDPKFRPSEEMLRFCRVPDVLRYLHRSHDYYVREAISGLSASIESLVRPCPDTLKRVIHKFYEDFRRELERHFAFEEQTVIPYVDRLLLGFRDARFTIDRFEENHAQIQETLSDLKNLIMKSLPDVCDPRLRHSVLLSIYSLQEDIDHHTCIEDDVLVPLVRMMESPGRPRTGSDSDWTADSREELSAREKEILVSVAHGLLNKEIADRHHISINTVITHRKNITRKTGIKTVAGLTAYAILNNLVDINEIE